MNDNNKKFSFRELCPAKIIRRIGALFMTVVTLLLSCGSNTLVAHAAEEQGTVKLHCGYNFASSSSEDCNYYKSYDLEIDVPAGWELVGSLSTSDNSHYDINLYMVKGNTFSILKNVIGDYYPTVLVTSYEDGSVKNSYEENINILPFQGDVERRYENLVFTVLSGSMKVFPSADDFDQYVANGGGHYAIVKPDTIEGEYDSSIGYLHNAQHHILRYGELDEYGVYENYTNKFTWDNTYPKYDDSYLVEIKGRYWLQTSGFLGLGETKEYTSDVRDIVKDIYYKDLKVMIDSQYIYDLFEDFREKYNPNKEGSSISWTGCTWRESDFYLRIYRWSDEDNCYHYGKWVNIHFKNSSYDCDVSAGDLDEDGNFIVDPDTDYGTGVDQDTKFGEGDDLNDADEDSDAVKDKDTFDLSNASFTDVWEWFTSALAGLISSVGAIPEFFKQIFSFLPNTIYVLIGVGIVIAIILRFLGR